MMLEKSADIARKDMGDSFKRRKGENRRSSSIIKLNEDGRVASIDNYDGEYFSYTFVDRRTSH